MKTTLITLTFLAASCGAATEVPVNAATQQVAAKQSISTTEVKTEVICSDLQESDVRVGVPFTKCDGTTSTGTLIVLAEALPTATPTATPTVDANLLPENIKSGIVIGGVTGTLTQPTQPDLTNLVASNIRSGVSINGVVGNLVQNSSPALCDGNAQVGCVTTSSWKSASFANLTASNIKNGVNVAGVVGESIPRYEFCTVDGQNGCSTSAVDGFVAAKVSNLNPATDLRSGVTIAGVTGTFQMPALSDIRKGVASGTLNARCVNGVPASESVWSAEATVDDNRSTSNSARYGGCSSITTTNSGAGMHQDSLSGIKFYYNYSSGTQATASTTCANLSFDGYDDYRLPTQKELMQLHINGLRTLIGDTTNATVIWSATNAGSFINSPNAWVVNPTTGAVSTYPKGSAVPNILCVR